jgi:hypothetical protein
MAKRSVKEGQIGRRVEEREETREMKVTGTHDKGRRYRGRGGMRELEEWRSREGT